MTILIKKCIVSCFIHSFIHSFLVRHLGQHRVGLRLLQLRSAAEHQFIEVGNCKEKTIILSQYTTIGFSPACSSCRTRMVRKYWETSRSISTLCDDAPCPSKCHQSDSISGQVYERMVFKGAAESPNCLVVTVMPKAWHWPYLPYFPHQPLD